MNLSLSFLRSFRDRVFGFRAIQARFDILHNKIDGIESKLDFIQSKLDVIQSEQDVMESNQDVMESNLEAIQSMLIEIKSSTCIVADTDDDVLERADFILSRAIKLGQEGKFKIAPEQIAISATNNCNLRCIMCLGNDGNSGPVLSVDEADILFSSLAGRDINFGLPRVLSMVGGESTLNPNLATIYRRFKELFPDAKISMISNATIPLRGQVREAFELADRIGLSMDGATAETFERIRKGAIYKNVVRNVQDIAKLKTLGVNCETLQLMFVAMDQNIHELPEMVRFAHSAGIPEVFVQISEVRFPPPFNDLGQNITLNLSCPELIPFLREAKSEADRLGISLSLTSTLQEILETTEQVQLENLPPTPKNFDFKIKTCNLPWKIGPGLTKDKEGIYPYQLCCHMPVNGRGDLYKHTELRGKSISEIFNSELYWDFRAGLLDGSAAKIECKSCQYYQMYQWTGSQLRELEAAMERIDNSITHCRH